MSSIKYAALGLLVLVFFAGTPLLATHAATCTLTKVQIAQAGLTATLMRVHVTTTPKCWSGAVQINQGNRDFNLITVQVNIGTGTGFVPRMETTGACSIYCIHPYATGPGIRGNNIFIPTN